MEKVINPKKAVFLFNADHPAGEMFTLTQDQLENKLQNGWFDTPALLDLPEDNDTGLTEEQVSNARPEDLVKLVESYGFIVLTPEQLKAEANKMAEAAFNPANLTDSAIIDEAERRGLKQSNESADELNALLDRFNEDPKSLNKEEHIILGKSLGLTLRSNFGEDTMIDKITEALNETE